MNWRREYMATVSQDNMKRVCPMCLENETGIDPWSGVLLCDQCAERLADKEGKGIDREGIYSRQEI